MPSQRITLPSALTYSSFQPAQHGASSGVSADRGRYRPSDLRRAENGASEWQLLWQLEPHDDRLHDFIAYSALYAESRQAGR